MLINFSERESKIIKIIGRGKMTIREISDQLFKKEPNTLDAETKVANTLSRIIKKCKHYKLSWSILKKREGRLLTIKKVKV